MNFASFSVPSSPVHAGHPPPSTLWFCEHPITHCNSMEGVLGGKGHGGRRRSSSPDGRIESCHGEGVEVVGGEGGGEQRSAEHNITR